MKRTLSFLALFISFGEALALEPGDQCDHDKVMPRNLICWENSAVDCTLGNLRRIESLMCASEDFRREDKILNVTYQKALKSLSGPGAGSIRSNPERRKKELIDAQRAWVAYRSTDCTSEGNMNGGDWNDNFIVACETKATIDRTRVLIERFLK